MAEWPTGVLTHESDPFELLHTQLMLDVVRLTSRNFQTNNQALIVAPEGNTEPSRYALRRAALIGVLDITKPMSNMESGMTHILKRLVLCPINKLQYGRFANMLGHVHGPSEGFA